MYETPIAVDVAAAESARRFQFSHPFSSRPPPAGRRIPNICERDSFVLLELLSDKLHALNSRNFNLGLIILLVRDKFGGRSGGDVGIVKRVCYIIKYASRNGYAACRNFIARFTASLLYSPSAEMHKLFLYLVYSALCGNVLCFSYKNLSRERYVPIVL